jgi:DNA mismatch repair protein MutS
MSERLTPLLEQYYRIKREYPDKILFFRMGDFYEMFGEDAQKAAPILGIALTSRAHGKNGDVPLAGVPYHAAEKYLTRLVEAGEKVVICEQTEDPMLARGLVRREVIEIITPGTVAIDGALRSDSNNYLAGFVRDGGAVGLSYVDLSTGEFIADVIPEAALSDRIMNLQPSEIVITETDEAFAKGLAKLGLKTSVTLIDGWKFDGHHALERLCEHFRVVSLDGFGFDHVTAGVRAAGALMAYLRETKMGALKHITKLSRTASDQFMFLDNATLSNLEIIAASDGVNSLYHHVNLTRTAMGARLLRRWLTLPLVDQSSIIRRQDAVAELLEKRVERKAVVEVLGRISDLERLAGKLGSLRLSPRDMIALAKSLEETLCLNKTTATLMSPALTSIGIEPLHLNSLSTLIRSAIVDEPPQSLSEGGIFRREFDPSLDQMKDDIKSAKDWIASLQERERARTGISALKVGFNRVFGYYIEVTNPHLSKVPQDYVRKQTLVSAERFITPDLKEREDLVLTAEEKINALEQRLFEELRIKLSENTALVQAAALFVAVTDVIASFASVADRNRYIRPTVCDSLVIDIRNGRHPVLENILPSGSFVPNDTLLDAGKSQVHIITGPNMAGKSTYLRQVGLIVLLAQVGSFVPADAATVGIADRIFTRVGATDKLTLGQSTFLVEMNETANILNNTTSRSLILLDEIGRGTSTFDGLAIAWSVSEYLHETSGRQARTLFATHYHELTELAARFKRVKNYQVAVREWQDQIIFLRKILPGGCDDSYGIEVARLAGLPAEVTDRAKAVLTKVEEGTFFAADNQPANNSEDKDLFAFKYGDSDRLRDRIHERILAVQPEKMTPLEALNLLAELKRIADEAK